jgi:hypothetical protein
MNCREIIYHPHITYGGVTKDEIERAVRSGEDGPHFNVRALTFGLPAQSRLRFSLLFLPTGAMNVTTQPGQEKRNEQHAFL